MVKLDTFRDPGVPAWLELISVAAVVAVSAQAIPEFGSMMIYTSRTLSRWVARHDLWSYVYAFIELGLGLWVALPAARRSGMRLGSLGGRLPVVAGVVALPVLLTVMIYPQLPARPYAGASSCMWTVVPVSEDMIFSGFIYGMLAQRGGRRIFKRLPFNSAMVVTALLFSLYHAFNIISFPTGYVLFQVLYTFVGSMWTGMTRVWTGSFLYVTVAHMAVNFIVWNVN